MSSKFSIEIKTFKINFNIFLLLVNIVFEFKYFQQLITFFLYSSLINFGRSYQAIIIIRTLSILLIKKNKPETSIQYKICLFFRNSNILKTIYVLF
jgi:hypothetical protein